MLIQRSRLATVSFDWSPDGIRYRLPRLPIKLSRRFKRKLEHCLTSCEIRKSTLRNAGSGVFLLESVQKGQILFKYGGRRISFPEADGLIKAVSIEQSPLIQMFHDAFPPWQTLQGLETHIKGNLTHAFCYDSRPTYEMKMDWFVRNHLVGGFLNSNLRRLCNGKFLTVGEDVFVVATKPMKRGAEVFVHYKVRYRVSCQY